MGFASLEEGTDVEKSLIEFRGVSLGYGPKPVLQNLSFAIEQGDFFAAVGPNGAGKTTILRAILGILTPKHGEIRRARREAGPVAFGYVPQERELDPIFPLSALEIVLMGRTRRLGPGRRWREEDRATALRSLDQAGIAQLFDVPFQELSGGQKQRVLLARALAGEPDVLVLDEPTAGMDLPSERSIMDIVGRLHREARLTIVMVTHNLNVVANYAKRLAIIDRERGIFSVGAIEEILTDENLSRLYGTAVQVREIAGRKTILTGGEP
jgi:ABC-type Mn2+/Zn2+ transport system ATPase subunit